MHLPYPTNKQQADLRVNCHQTGKPNPVIKNRAQYLAKQVQWSAKEAAWTTTLRALREELFDGEQIPFRLRVLGYVPDHPLWLTLF